MKWRALDLFSGIGGWSLAAHRKGIETVAACEIDDWKWKQYHRHFPHVHRYRDVREITRSRLEADGRLPIHVIVGSPPCTDISTANHAGLGVDGEESKLYFEAIRIVAAVRPLWVAFENSDNLRSRGADRVLAALEAEGYACFPCVVGAVHAGAPHRRNRSWLVATYTDRSGLREQSGWSGRTNGKGTPEPAADDRQRTADAHGVDRRAGRWQGHANRNEFARRGAPALDDAHADSEGKHGIAKHAEVVGWSSHAGCAVADRASGGGGNDADSDSAGLEVGQVLRRYDAQELSAIERGFGLDWNDGPGSLARGLREHDGISSRMVGATGSRRRAIVSELNRARSAYGDSVVVPVVEAILDGIIEAETWMRGTEK